MSIPLKEIIPIALKNYDLLMDKTNFLENYKLSIKEEQRNLGGNIGTFININTGKYFDLNVNIIAMYYHKTKSWVWGYVLPFPIAYKQLSLDIVKYFSSSIDQRKEDDNDLNHLTNIFLNSRWKINYYHEIDIRIALFLFFAKGIITGVHKINHKISEEPNDYVTYYFAINDNINKLIT